MDDSILPIPKPANRYREFRDLVFRETEVGENSGLQSQPGQLPELEIQARWFGGEFGRKFTSTDGKPIEIVQFGHWNHGPGPDFTETAVKISGEIHTGAVELDLAVDSWEAHGHGSNPEFNKVVLHVFLQGDTGGRRFFTRSENHKAIPQIQISLEQLADSNPSPILQPEAKLGRCASPLGNMSEKIWTHS